MSAGPRGRNGIPERPSCKYLASILQVNLSEMFATVITLKYALWVSQGSWTFCEANWLIQFYLNNTLNLRHLSHSIKSCHTHKIVSYCVVTKDCDVISPYSIGPVELTAKAQIISAYTHTYWKGKTNLDFTEARDSEWQWHQLGHMQVCTLLQTDNHASTPPLRRSVFTGRIPFLPPAAQPTTSKHWRQSRGNCNWQIGLILIAKLQMYRVRRPTNNYHQTASKCTKSRTQFQKFSRGDTPGPPSARGEGKGGLEGLSPPNHWN